VTEDWKAAHDSAKEYIAALEEAKNDLRDQCIAAIRDRDEWRSAYQAAMRPPEYLA
jgi:hypothetical protein